MVVVPVIKSEASPVDFLPFALFVVGVLAAGILVVRRIRKRARKEVLKESPKPEPVEEGEREVAEEEQEEEEAVMPAPSRGEEDYYSDWGDGKW
jgi:hypothetical protein